MTGQSGLTAAQIVGTWALADFVVEVSDGRRFHPFGEGARGRILYGEDGFMSAILSRPERPGLSTDGLEAAAAASDGAKARSFDSYLSYGGRWRLEGGAVHHHVDLALVPDVVGTVLRRTARLDGDALVLTYDRPTRSGATARYVLRWRRPADTRESDS